MTGRLRQRTINRIGRAAEPIATGMDGYQGLEGLLVPLALGDFRPSIRRVRIGGIRGSDIIASYTGEI